MTMSREEIKETGRTTLRQQLEHLGSERTRDRHADAMLPVALRAAWASGLRMTGMSASVGLSRQGTYDALDREADDERLSDTDLAPLVAATLAATAPTDAGALASNLRLDTGRTYSILQRLKERGHARFVGSAGYETPDSSVWAITDEGLDWLDDHGRSLAWSRSHTAVYFRVEDPAELDRLATAVEQIVGRDWCSVLPAGTTSSPSPEIAVAVTRTADQREALDKAHDIWFEARDDADLPPRLPRIAAVAW